MNRHALSADHLIAEVLGMVGEHARALHALLSVSTIEWNSDVTTACIECRDHPSLLLNPEFVAKWCTTPQRLAALVLHEMLHVTLGHTRLYPRPTPAHNVAFDAIINRMLLRSIADAGLDPEPFAELFTSYYDADGIPGLLLRPPPGWPTASDWSVSEGVPERLRAIQFRLYGEANGRGDAENDVTYADILAALLRVGATGACGEVSLLGTHGATPAEAQALTGTRDTDIVDALGGPMELLRGVAAGAGTDMGHTQVRDADRSHPFERALRSWLRSGVQTVDEGTRRTRWQARQLQVVHRHEDRRAMVRAHAARCFGAPAPLFFAGTVLEQRPDPVEVPLYVDVSGSMSDALPRIRRTLRELWREITPRVHWFSTQVVEGRRGDLAGGRLPSTGGTAVSCVLEHAIATGVRRSVFVLTDGHVEAVAPALVAAASRAGIRVHLGVVGPGPLHASAPWVTAAVRLPNL